MSTKKSLDKTTKFVNKHKFKLILLAIILMFVIVQAQYIFKDGVWNDETLYMWMGEQLTDDPSYMFSSEMIKYNVFLPTIIMSTLNFIMPIFYASHLTIFIFAIVGLLFAYLLGKELKNEWVGLIAVALISVNHLYNVIATRVLIDVPLATLFTIVAYCLLKYEKIKSFKWAIILAIVLVLTVMSKHTAILSVAFVGLYYLTFYLVGKVKRKKIISDDLKELVKRKSFYVFLVIFAGLMSVIMWVRGSSGSEVLAGQTKITELGMLSKVFAIQLPFVLNWSMLIIFIISFIVLIMLAVGMGKKEHYIMLTWFISYFGIFSMLHLWQSPPRYMIPIIPIISLTVAFMCMVVYTMSDKKLHKVLTIGGIGLIIFASVIMNMGMHTTLQTNKQQSYIGYLETGKWMQTNIAEEHSIIISESYRQIRAFSGFDYAENGGIVYFASTFQNKTTFETFVNSTNKTVYLQTDVWEYTAPAWLHPMDTDRYNYLVSIGFTPLLGVDRQIQGQKVTVVAMFSK